MRNRSVLSHFCSLILSTCNDRLPALQGMDTCERLFRVVQQMPEDLKLADKTTSYQSSRTLPMVLRTLSSCPGSCFPIVNYKFHLNRFLATIWHLSQRTSLHHSESCYGFFEASIHICKFNSLEIVQNSTANRS